MRAGSNRIVTRRRSRSQSSGSIGRKAASIGSPVSLRRTWTCRATSPSLIGAENSTYSFSWLRGSVVAVGKISTTRVAAPAAGRGTRHGERDVVVELERLRLTRVARTVDERVDEGVVHEHAVVGAGKEREPGHEAQGVAVGRVVPGNRWQRSRMTEGAAPTGPHALDDLGGRDDHPSIDGRRVGRDQRGRGAGGQPGHPQAAGAVQRRELGVQGPRYSDAALSERRWRAPDSSCCSAST